VGQIQTDLYISNDLTKVVRLVKSIPIKCHLILRLHVTSNLGYTVNKNWHLDESFACSGPHHVVIYII
jgi:hypothetical protein